MRILLICHHDWAGAVYSLMKAVNDHTDHDARAITLESTWMNYPHDVLDPSWVDLWRLFRWADVLNLYDNVPVMLPEAMLDKPVVRSYLGSEYRKKWKHFNQQDRERGWPQTCTTIDLALFGPTWLGVPQAAIDRPEPSEPFTVCHAPTNRSGKGTKLVIEALDGLDVKLDIIERLPHDKCMERKAKAHLLIDQVGPRALGYGCNALEAWAMGMPVISDAHDEVCRALMGRTLSLPFYKASTADQIRAAVEELRKPDVYATWRDRGRRHLCAWHDPAVVAECFIEICRQAMNPQPQSSTELPKVYSHPRSGTAFLGATLKKCFYPDVDTATDGGPAGHWSNRTMIAGRPYGKLIGDHDFWNGKPGVYIYRDGRDVAVSLWRTKMMMAASDSDLSFAEYLRKPLDWHGTPARGHHGNLTIAEHWANHLDSWNGRPGVLMVRYEDLILNPAEVLETIGNHLGITPHSLEPEQERIGIVPHEGRIGTWYDYFTGDDLEFFYSKVSPNHWGLYHAYHPKLYWQRRGQDYKTASCPDELDNFNDWFKLLNAKQILDIGAGWGRVYLQWRDLQLDGSYTMCDFTSSMLDGCEQVTGIRPDEWDGKTLPYADNEFDLGVSFSVFLHVPPADVKSMLAEHVRTCKHLFIATLESYNGKLAPHCFVHDYESMFAELGVDIVDKRQFDNRAHWLLKT